MYELCVPGSRKKGVSYEGSQLWYGLSANVELLDHVSSRSATTKEELGEFTHVRLGVVQAHHFTVLLLCERDLMIRSPAVETDNVLAHPGLLGFTEAAYLQGHRHTTRTPRSARVGRAGTGLMVRPCGRS